MIGSVAEFGHDALTLAELQARLAALEWNENAAKAKGSVLALAISGILACATLPILLIGIAELLAEFVRRGYAYLIVTGVMALVIGIVVAVAVSTLRRQGLGFPRTREELTRNSQWLRTVLMHSGRPIPNRRG